MSSDEFAKLIDALFGYGVPVGFLPEKLAQHKDRFLLQDVALRVYLVDMLRFRGTIPRSPFFYTPYYGFILNKQLESLGLHLLCTCVDALAGEDFIDYPRWLGVTTKKKAKYRIDDEQIKLLLATFGDLNDPDIFRQAANSVYQQSYLPQYGNQKGFIRFFEELPQELSDILISAYTLTEEFDDDTYTTYLIDPRVRGAIFRDWKSRPPIENLRDIGRYFYVYHRNQFTHKSASPMPQEGDRIRNDFIQIADDRNQMRRFRVAAPESEFTMLRLAVVISWLGKVGFDIEAGYVNGFRQYQAFRERLYRAMYEVDWVVDVWSYYAGDPKRKELEYGSFVLPWFNTESVREMRSYLNDTENRLRELMLSYLTILDPLNKALSVYNSMLPEWSGFSRGEQKALLQARKMRFYTKINSIVRARSSVFEEVARWVRFELDERTDRMI